MDEDHTAKCFIESDARKLRVVREHDNRVLIEVSRGDDTMMELVADTLSAHKLPLLAEKVRRIHNGREGMVTVS